MTEQHAAREFTRTEAVMVPATARKVAAVDRLLYTAGLRLGLPTRSLRRAVRFRRVLANADSWRARRSAAQALANGPFADFIAKETGFSIAPPVFPGLAEAVAAGRSVLAAWEASDPDLANWDKPDNNGKRDPNFNILTAEQLHSYPALLDFALSRPVAELLGGYLGQIPRLVQLDVRITLPNDSNGGAVHDDNRAFHVDDRDDNCSKVRCIVLLDEVRSDTGPFTFVARAATRRVRQALGRRWWGPTRFGDPEVLPHLRPGELRQLTGPAGTAIFIDTGRCLHFGNRTTAGRRAIIMLQYKLAPEGGLGPSRPKPPRPNRYDLSQFRRHSDAVHRRLMLEPRF